MTRRHPALRFGTGALIGALMGLLACSDSGPIDPTTPVGAAAKGGGAAPPKVDAADPNDAPPDTSLIVRVIGSGFDDGSVARFLLAGEDVGDKMVVKATNYVDGDSLDVDLTITADADVALYDIEVTTFRGKKGIGTEKFSVKQTGPPPDSIPVTAEFRQSAADATPTDGVLSDSTSTTYDAVILPIGNLFLDSRKDTDRRLCLSFDDPVAPYTEVCPHGYFSTAQPTESGGLPAMGVGSTMKTVGQVTWVRDRFNWFLNFGQSDCGGNQEDNRIEVTRTGQDTWVLVGSRACLSQLPTKGRPVVTDVGFFDMPFQLTVTRKPVP
jgi:hypothetical protein